VGHLHAGCAKDISLTFKSNEPRSIKNEMITCELTKIYFDKPISEVKDWDDRIHVIKWVTDANPSDSANRATSPNNTANSVNSQTRSAQVTRKKIAEIEPEPKCMRSEDSVQPLELYVTANCDYAKYKSSANVVRFKETLMFQTRVFE
jgi:hydrocephalus-inducing protein